MRKQTSSRPSPARGAALLAGVVILSYLFGSADAQNLDANKRIDTTLNIATAIPAEIRHPLAVGDFGDSEFIQHFLFSPLVAPDVNGVWQCVLCESLPSEEAGTLQTETTGNQERLVTTWRLKEDVFWNDGTRLLAKDITFSWDLLQARHQSTSGDDSLDQIHEISLVKGDERAFTISYHSKLHSFAQLRDFVILPSHIEGLVWQASSMDFDHYIAQSNYHRDPLQAGLYSGPYTPTTAKPLELKPNPWHFAQRTDIDLIAFHFKNTASQLAAAVGRGEINFLTPTVTEQLSSSQQQEIAKSLKRIEVASFRYEHLLLNLRNPILADVKVRHALAAALSVDSNSDSFFSAEAVSSANSFAPPGDSHYQNRSTLAPVKKANTFLEEAGWRKDEEGVFHKDGTPLHLTIDIAEDQNSRKRTAEWIADNLRQYGFKIDIVTNSHADFFTTLLPQARFADTALFAWEIFPASVPRNFLHSAEIPSRDNKFNGQNYGGWRRREVDHLIESYVRELDPKKQKDLVAAIVQFYQQDLPAIPLFFAKKIAFIPHWLRGFQLDGHWLPASSHAGAWHRFTDHQLRTSNSKATDKF